MEDTSRPVQDSPNDGGTGRLLLDKAAQAVLDVLHFLFSFLGWTVRWSVATLFLLAVMGGAAWFVFTQAAQGGSYVLVPDVTGLPVTRAANVLVNAGLELGEQRQVASDRVPEYHVILQRPSANKVVIEGRKVSLTISAGEQYETTPGFIGKTLSEAHKELESTRLRAGSVARIPNTLPADTVLAQDPEPRTPIAAGSEVHLLISDGPGVVAMIMPTLTGKSLEEAQLILAKLDVTSIPYKVDRPGAEYEVVLAQYPDPGSRLLADQEISFDVRLLPTSYLPNARRKVTARYTVPQSSQTVAVRVETIDQRGTRSLIYPLLSDYVEGRPPRLAPGTVMTFTDLTFQNEMTLEFLADGRLHSSYYYQGDADPIVTTRELQTNGEPNAGRVHSEDLEKSPAPRGSTGFNRFRRPNRP